MSPGNTIFDTKNAQSLTGEEELALESELIRIFSNSRQPLSLIKRNNDLVFSIIKKFLSTHFAREGVFETLFLTVQYFHKLDLDQLRGILKFSSSRDGGDRESSQMRTRFANGTDPATKLTKYKTSGKEAFNITYTANGLHQIAADANDEEDAKGRYSKYFPETTRLKAPFLPPRAKD